MRNWAIVPAAGAGRRMGGSTRKQFAGFGGKAVLVHTLQALESWAGFSGIVVVVPADEVERVRGLLEGAGLGKILRVVAGGSERQDSVRLGLDALTEAGSEDLVFVHDGVRPFPPVERFEALRDSANPDGALLAVPCSDTLKREAEGRCVETVDRRSLWQAQTPQVFPAKLLRKALQNALAEGILGTDEADLVQRVGRRPKLVPGDRRNIKLTTPEDLALAEKMSAGGCKLAGPLPAHLHVGHGYDVHRLVEGRKLILGGVEVPHSKGLLGHSDADVLAHAVADACLGASALGDLGRHFPDSDQSWKGASSLDLLTRIAAMLRERHFQIVRVDATLVAERPKIAAYVPRMQENLSRALGGADLVTVKATTTEGLGFEGRGEGMSAHAVCLLKQEIDP